MDYTYIQRNINIDQIVGSSIFEDGNFNSIKQYAYKLIDSSDTQAALSFAKKLESKITQVKPVDQKQAYLSQILYFWVLRLKLFVLTDLTVQEKKDLFKGKITQILNSDLDLQN